MSASAPEQQGRTVRWPRMRPRFHLQVGCSVGQLMDALRAGAERPEAGVEGHFSERHGVLTLPEDERQFWSTQLGITVEAQTGDVDGEPACTRVLGVFSPHPEIWTAYVFAIGTLTGVGVFGALYTVVQWSVGQAPWAALVSLFALLAGGLVYTSTLVGQSLALGEMYRLRSHLDECLEGALVRARAEPTSAMDSAQL
jgi:hypothetical protein